MFIWRNKIIFGFPNMKYVNNLYDKSDEIKIFTAVTYTAKGICLIANNKGEIKVFEGTKKHTLSSWFNSKFNNFKSIT